jgi:SAM-dependent methyltransferase
MRSEAYGEGRALSSVDRFGVWLSSLAVRRHADFDGQRVADFGCGYEASFARTVLPGVRELLLVDLHLAEDLRRHPKVKAVDGQIEIVLPTVADESLDVVLCLSVLEHLREPQQALNGFRRILAPGGAALINVPSWRGKQWLELSAFRLGLSPAMEMDDHKRYYDPRDLWPLLVQAGFRPSEISCKRHKLGLNTFAVCRVPTVTTAQSAHRSQDQSADPSKGLRALQSTR